jgi:tetratricopeptide (TPR) repeat protein
LSSSLPWSSSPSPSSFDSSPFTSLSSSPLPSPSSSSPSSSPSQVICNTTLVGESLIQEASSLEKLMSMPEQNSPNRNGHGVRRETKEAPIDLNKHQVEIAETYRAAEEPLLKGFYPRAEKGFIITLSKIDALLSSLGQVSAPIAILEYKSYSYRGLSQCYLLKENRTKTDEKKALGYLKRALLGENGFKETSWIPRDLGNLYSELGWLSDSAGERNEAIEYYKKTLEYEADLPEDVVSDTTRYLANLQKKPKKQKKDSLDEGSPSKKHRKANRT